MAMKLKVSRKRLIWALSGAIDLVGVTDLFHGKRVAYLADQLRAHLGEFPWSQDDVILAGLLHDCGVSSTDVHEQLAHSMEWAYADEHCKRGEVLLRNVKVFAHLAQAIRFHHRHWNPNSHNSSEVLGNLLFLADRIDVLSKSESEDILISRNQVRNTINAHSGTLFNPEYVQAFNDLSNRDVFWLNWQESHSGSVMGSWYSNEEPCEIEYAELKEIFTLFSSCVDGKSPYTYNHSLGVAQIARKLASLLNLPEETCEKIELAALLHDIGKLRIPDHILEKKEALSPDEVQIMHHHSYDTYNILSSTSGLNEIVLWAMQHHEKLNGSGYPEGVSASRIPISSRIITVSDIYQALGQDRPYRKAMQFEQILEILQEMVRRGELDKNIVQTVAENRAALAHQ